MLTKRFNFLPSLIILLFSFNVQGKTFTSQYCEFELPSGWECALEGTEWVCQSNNKDRKKEAIIILAAKIRGGQDSLDAYKAYLRQTKTFTLPGGKTQVSEAKYAKTAMINQHQWIDALHLASEVPGFYTRYLATVKADLGVAVTLSVSKDHYQSYQKTFDEIVKTLKVFRQTKKDLSRLVLKDADKNLLDNTTFIPDSDEKFDIKQKKKKGRGGGGPLDGNMLYILLGLGAVAGVIALKKKKGKGKSRKRK